MKLSQVTEILGEKAGKWPKLSDFEAKAGQVTVDFAVAL